MPPTYGDTAVAVHGELTWSPPPRPLVWWPLYLLIPVAGRLAGLVPRSARPLTLLLAAAVTSAAWHVTATPQPGLTVTDRVLATGAALLPTLVAVAVTVTGVAVRAARRDENLLAAMLAAVVGFMLLIQGFRTWTCCGARTSSPGDPSGWRTRRSPS
ncbi:hypothetical protein GCM10023328_44830 [Modestobacter marinus]|uniref:Uncharacterized protein n=1 Tax=Modestobacter marinus TaxID=477641 RepID=A0ABQ2GAF6_9ACTN|nr:hypothetical protein GCM10011589_44490 [Modestobacter marinus]